MPSKQIRDDNHFCRQINQIYIKTFRVGKKGCRKGEILDWRDTGREKFVTEGIQEGKNSGLEGYKKR